MGGGISVSWTEEADSLSGEAGKKSVVSDPVQADGLTATKYWEASEKLTKTRGVVGWEKAYECTELPDGGLLAVSTFPAPGGEGELVTYTTIHTDRKENLCVGKSYLTDSTVAEQNCVSASYMKIYEDPFRFEWWMDEFAGRRTSSIFTPPLKELLAKMGSQAKVHCDAPSVTSPGQLSILSDPIEDCSVTAETFLEFIKADLLKDGAVEDTDGTIKETTSSWVSATTYRVHKLDGANNSLLTQDYGADPSYKNLKGCGTIKALNDPFRLEFWVDSVNARRANAGQKEFVSGLVKDVLKTIQ